MNARSAAATDGGQPGAGMPAPGSTWEVARAFLVLGMMSFGGPIAHIGYFHQAFVVRRRWLDETTFAQLLALCQFLPGPASSQLGFAIGLRCAGWRGALAALIAFTLPSAALMFALALALPHVDGALGWSVLDGLKILAVVVVTHALISMTRSLCPDRVRVGVAILAALSMLAIADARMQIIVIGVGALLGMLACRHVVAPASNATTANHGSRAGVALFALFVLLLVTLPVLAHRYGGLLQIADAFFRAGALVFGGGHVVLPLLETSVVGPGWVSTEDFISGYGAAQALPGPLFSFATFLGARASISGSASAGAIVATVAVFLPGLLLVACALPVWRSLQRRPRVAHAVAGVNASVVGILAAALIDPLLGSAIRMPADAAVAVIGLVLLVFVRAPVLLVMAWCVGARVAITLVGGTP